MGKTHFTSDLHIRHRSILRYTPRGEVLGFGPQNEDEDLPLVEVERRVTIHDQWVLDTINAHVQPQDNLYILGDLFFGDKWLAAYWISQIKCRHKFLVPGNHDHEQPGLVDFYADCGLFEAVYPHRAEVKIDGLRYVLDHYPIVEWNKGHRGSLMLHGHCHANFNYAKADLADKKILDVGWDSSVKVLGEYRPFELADIAKFMEGRVNITHHNKAG
jgi:calcineurin-like phosphoesterase family protein